MIGRQCMDINCLWILSQVCSICIQILLLQDQMRDCMKTIKSDKRNKNALNDKNQLNLKERVKKDPKVWRKENCKDWRNFKILLRDRPRKHANSFTTFQNFQNSNLKKSLLKTLKFPQSLKVFSTNSLLKTSTLWLII